MKKFLFMAAVILLALGCARLSVQGSKEPIKLDIAMRLDVYQHVEKDIDAIEGIVSGAKDTVKPADKQSFLSHLIDSAYAQEGLSPEVEQAALRRRDRVNELSSLAAKAVVGENRSGLVEVRDQSQATDAVNQLVSAENSDRMIIYKSVAAKNNTSVEEVEKLYAKRMHSSALAGTPIEVLNDASGAYEWKVK